MANKKDTQKREDAGITDTSEKLTDALNIEQNQIKAAVRTLEQANVELRTVTKNQPNEQDRKDLEEVSSKIDEVLINLHSSIKGAPAGPEHISS